MIALDVMPGLDGFSICESVRSRYHGAIITLTARGEEVGEVLALEVGADDYMAKPVRPRALLARLPDAAAVAVHVYFPGPWWKKRHSKRRVMRESLLRDVERILTDDGRLHIWTDVAEYFDETLELIHEVTDLTGPIDVAERPAEHDLDFRTHFERRMRLHDEPAYRSEFRRSR